MIELSPANYPAAAPLFQQTHYGVLAAATIEGRHPGRVFVDQAKVPAAGLVCIKAGIGYYFLAGQPAEPFIDQLYEAFRLDFIPAQKSAAGNPEVLLFYDPPAWREPLFARFATCKPISIAKKRFILPEKTAQALRDLPERAPAGLSIKPFTAALLAAHPELAGEVQLFFDSVDAFLQNSLGVAVMDGDTIASSCYAVFTASGEAFSACAEAFSGRAEAEINIATHPDYRQRGLAFMAGAAFIKNSLERGLNPIWGSWPNNLPSMALARKLGFVEDAEQPVCLWVDSPDWNP